MLFAFVISSMSQANKDISSLQGTYAIYPGSLLLTKESVKSNKTTETDSFHLFGQDSKAVSELHALGSLRSDQWTPNIESEVQNYIASMRARCHSEFKPLDNGLNCSSVMNKIAAETMTTQDGDFNFQPVRTLHSLPRLQMRKHPAKPDCYCQSSESLLRGLMIQLPFSVPVYKEEADGYVLSLQPDLNGEI
ncbi:unnamed protein product [Protopolystoma xenopodis]|uniref:Uncharacterized protein n=1 Tax=Protopolystoma xenopodis TaxID=117903 RepID=A0A3S5CI29_9PLAT|nr:unnamed protein product [Protopolystoma xenopodis]